MTSQKGVEFSGFFVVMFLDVFGCFLDFFFVFLVL